MSDVVPWFIGSNYTENVVFLLGLALGCLFGFDGWKRPLRSQALFKDSYRVVALKFIATGAGIGLLGDIKGLTGGQIDHFEILRYYLVGVFFGSVVIVGGMGLTFSLASVSKLAFDRKNHPDLRPNAGAFYLQNGWDDTLKAWQESVEKKAQVAQHDSATTVSALVEFHNAFIKAITRLIAQIELLHGQPSEHLRGATLRDLLDYIVDIVSRYCRLEGRGKNAKFEANYLHFIDRQSIASRYPDFEAHLDFCRLEASEYNRFLSLEAQTQQSMKPIFILPVENGRLADLEQRSLPGAPIAVLKGETFTFPDIARDMKFGQSIKHLKTRVKDHFENRQIRGLICSPILGSAHRKPQIFGVLNVECTEADVLDCLPDDKLILTDLLLPFRTLFARVLEIDIPPAPVIRSGR